ncbi:MAG TPA: hypothetical protein VJ761_23190 [Ktedonobacteraceae bacterium]|nr:hypothetical protein [Ktedonobacteraceae bacterium]
MAQDQEKVRYLLGFYIQTLNDAGQYERLHNVLWDESVSELRVNTPVKKAGWRTLFSRQSSPQPVEVRQQHYNCWYSLKENNGDTEGYVADIRLAWKQANNCRIGVDSEGNLASAVGLQCRYAMFVASINRLASHIPVNLLGAMVRRKLWTPARGLAYARQLPEATQRAAALQALAPYLYDKTENALEIARAITYIRLRIETLLALTPYLPQGERVHVISDSLAAIDTTDNIFDQAEMLTAVLPYLQQEEQPNHAIEALSVIKAMVQDKTTSTPLFQEPRYRTESQLLAAIAPYLPASSFDEVLAVIKLMPYYSQPYALAWTAPYLPKSLLHDAFSIASAVEFREFRGVALAGLAPYLPEKEQKVALDEAVATLDIKKDSDYEQKIETLELLVKAAMKQCETERLALLNRIMHAVAHDFNKYIWYKADALIKLAPFLPGPFLEKATQMAHQMRPTSGYNRLRAMIELANYVPQATRTEMIAEVLEVVRSIPGNRQPEWNSPDSLQAEALTSIAMLLPEQEQDALLQEAYTAALVIENEPGHGYKDPEYERLIAALAESLAASGAEEEAFTLVQSIQDTKTRVAAFEAAAPHLSTPHLYKMLAEGRAMRPGNERLKVLTAVASALPEAEKLEVLIGALQEAKDDATEQLLQLLLPYHNLLQQTFEHTLSSKKAWPLIYILKVAGPELTEDQQRKVLATLPSKRSANSQAEALEYLAPHLSLSLLHEAVDVALRLSDVPVDSKSEGEWRSNYGARSRALKSLLVQFVQRGELQEAIRMLREMGEEDQKTQALKALAPYLTEDLKQDVFLLVQETKAQETRATLLAALVPYLTDQSRQQALQAVLAMKYHYYRAKALLELVPSLTADERTMVSAEILNTIPAIESVVKRVEVLTEYYAYASEEERSFLRIEAEKAIDSLSGAAGQEASALSTISLYLARAGLIEQALNVARNAQNSDMRIPAFTSIMPYLTQAQLPDILVEALALVPGIGDIAGRRMTGLSSLVPFMQQLPLPELYTIWVRTLETFSSQSRMELFAELRTLVPIIEKLGGTAGIRQTYQAAQYVIRCWQ